MYLCWAALRASPCQSCSFPLPSPSIFSSRKSFPSPSTCLLRSPPPSRSLAGPPAPPILFKERQGLPPREGGVCAWKVFRRLSISSIRFAFSSPQVTLQNTDERKKKREGGERGKKKTE
ncbi:hypothetical protein E2320_013971 [Naja naja]|nr:hypothetical protein E2320_013971 [Naja naja]